jgi:hypothetical protein
MVLVLAVLFSWIVFQSWPSNLPRRLSVLLIDLKQPIREIAMRDGGANGTRRQGNVALKSVANGKVTVPVWWSRPRIVTRTRNPEHHGGMTVWRRGHER